MQDTIVYKDPGAYSCFPAVWRRKNGELIASFRLAGDFSVDALKRGTYDHVDKGSRIAVARSLDSGQTWQKPVIIPAFDPECGEQDPSIMEMRNGTLLINFFRWRVVPAAEKARLAYPTRQQHDGSWGDVEGPWIVRSFDGGKTWEKKPEPVASSPLRCAGVSDAVLEMPDGTLLMGFYGADAGSRVCRAYVARSTDGGNTWGEPALIARDPAGKITFEEPALALTPRGRLIALLRAGDPDRITYLYRAFSDDGGRTWVNLTRPDMWGHPAHVLPLADGRIVCSYGYRREPFGVRACISLDDGETWDMAHEYILRSDGGSRDLGYPSSVQLADGALLTVYYIHAGDGIRHIACTRWRAD